MNIDKPQKIVDHYKLISEELSKLGFYINSYCRGDAGEYDLIVAYNRFLSQTNCVCREE